MAPLSHDTLNSTTATENQNCSPSAVDVTVVGTTRRVTQVARRLSESSEDRTTARSTELKGGLGLPGGLLAGAARVPERDPRAPVGRDGGSSEHLRPPSTRPIRVPDGHGKEPVGPSLFWSGYRSLDGVE